MEKISKKSIGLVICSGIIILMLILFFLAPAPLIFIKDFFKDKMDGIVYNYKIFTKQPCENFNSLHRECPDYCYTYGRWGSCSSEPPPPSCQKTIFLGKETEICD